MEEIVPRNNVDPSINVRSIVDQEVGRLDDLRRIEVKRFDERIDDLGKTSGVVSLKEHFDEIIRLNDVKYQIQFNSAKENIGIASTAQEKAMTAAQEGTKDALDKADTNNDKRFDGISQKIDGVSEQLNKNAGSQGIYVTHDYLNNAFDKFRIDMESILKPIVSKLTDVTTFMNSQTGKSSGLNAGWIYLVGAIGLISTIIGIFLSMSRFLP